MLCAKIGNVAHHSFHFPPNLFLVTWPRQELSIFDTDDKDMSGDEDVEGELSVEEKLELAGVEHFGGLSRMFGALF